MSLWKFVAAQLAQPRGLFGGLVMGRLLNKTNVAEHQLVFDTLAVAADERLLELGFGGGSLLFKIAALLERGHIDGVELSAEMIATAQRRSRRLDSKMTLHRASVDELPFADASFDCVYSVHTIYFWPDLQRGLAELARVLKPGGRLVLGFSADIRIIQGGYSERGFKAYSLQQIRDVCQAQGIVEDCLKLIEDEKPGAKYVMRGIKHR